jgi:thioredoxin reductase (NADPH)
MPEEPAREVWDIAVIGGGPAGLACAIYAGRARLRILIIEKMITGGRMTTNPVIENYPGFPDGIEGTKLAEQMTRQAERFGAQTEFAEVNGIGISARPFRIHTASGDRLARAVLIATGSSPRHLGVPGEKELFGRGVSYCATCDGPLYLGKRVVVVGGGNTAVEEALFLTNFASHVTIVHRRDQLRADRILQERAFANEKVAFLWSHVVTRVVGEAKVAGVRARSVVSGEEMELPAEGVFIAVGNVPQTGFLPAEIELDEAGFIVTDQDLQTSVPGIFAAGDVRAGAFRQMTFAVGDGTLAYRSMLHYLDSHP